MADERRAAEATETTIALRWRDMDAYGHVNHAVFLTYLEEARGAAYRHVLRGVAGAAGFVVARVAIDYRRELRREDGPITVSCWFTTIGSTSLGTREVIRNAAGETVAESEAVIVKFDREQGRPRPWTEDERAAFSAAGARPRG